MTEIHQFVDTIPQRIRRCSVAADIIQYKWPFKTEVAIRAHSQHDALHYLSRQPFTIEGEECVAYLENKFQRGWLPLGKQYNRFSEKECDCSMLTVELIDETAKIIYEIYDDYDDGIEVGRWNIF